MTKQNFYDFGITMANDSKLLYNNGKYHNSVYIGGYILESYIKIILLNNNYQYEEIKQHLGDKELVDKINRLISFYPELFENSLLIKEDRNYPKFFFNGGSNKTHQSKWNVNQRYNIIQWSEENFCQKIQKEIAEIEKALIRIQREGVLNDCN